MSRNNTYSRWVFGIKLVLPVLALLSLSTLFLFSRNLNPDDALPFAEADVTELAREQRLTAPRFTGVTQDGSVFSVIADKAQPNLSDPRKMSADFLSMVVDPQTPSGIRITADTGVIDTGARQVQLAGNVGLQSSSGYRLKTDQLMARFDVLEVFAPETVTGTGPLGDLIAGQMRLQKDPETGHHVLVFLQGVNLIYEPSSQ